MPVVLLSLCEWRCFFDAGDVFLGIRANVSPEETTGVLTALM
jgi:hypothetical protein